MKTKLLNYSHYGSTYTKQTLEKNYQMIIITSKHITTALFLLARNLCYSCAIKEYKTNQI